MEIRVTYMLSEEGRKAAALAGVPAQSKQEICVKAEDLDKDLLEKIVEQEGVQSDGNIQMSFHLTSVLGYKVNEEQHYYSHEPATSFTKHTLGSTYGTLTCDRPMTIQELIDHKLAHEAKLAEQKEQVEQEVAKFEEADRESQAKAEAAFALIQQTQENAKERRRKMEQEAKEEEARRVQERKIWIQQHGSERLKLAQELGMDDASVSVYLDERLAHEHPGFVFNKDWHRGKVRYKDVINPTLEELQALKEVRANLPTARLEFAQLIEEDDYSGEKTVVVRERVITAFFFGDRIIRRF